MGDTADRYSRDIQQGDRGIALDRILFFTDAVFAIAITLLVIDLTVRTVGADGKELSTATIATEMLQALPDYAAYVISFFVIGATWAAHHQNFSLLARWDTALKWVNLLLLLFVAFLPFPTRMLFSGDGDIQHVQYTFYAGTVLAIGLIQLWMWRVVRVRGLLDVDRVDRRIYRYEQRQIAVTPAVFGFGLVLEFTVGSPWSLYVWFLQVPLSFLAGRFEPREPEAAASQSKSRLRVRSRPARRS
ncbi:MAG: DUF1211 domain-containing protein [Micrococcales bacterium]|nr:DUF1211 domain-containing protein [Micrococcales bacterium]